MIELDFREKDVESDALLMRITQCIKDAKSDEIKDMDSVAKLCELEGDVYIREKEKDKAIQSYKEAIKYYDTKVEKQNQLKKKIAEIQST